MDALAGHTFRGSLLRYASGPGIMCEEGETVMVADLLERAGLSGGPVEMEFVDGALVIRRQGAFDGIPKDRDELTSTLLACQFFGGRWVAPAERGVILTGPSDSAEGWLQVTNEEITIQINRKADGGSGHLSAEELARYAADSGVTPGTSVSLFFFGPGPHGLGVGFWVRPAIADPKA